MSLEICTTRGNQPEDDFDPEGILVGLRLDGQLLYLCAVLPGKHPFCETDGHLNNKMEQLGLGREDVSFLSPDEVDGYLIALKMNEALKEWLLKAQPDGVLDFWLSKGMGGAASIMRMDLGGDVPSARISIAAKSTSHMQLVVRHVAPTL